MNYRIVHACVSTLCVVLSTSVPAFADPPNDAPTPDPVARDVRSEVPIVAYAYGASGVTAGSVGVQAYGVGLAGAGQRAIGGGAAASGDRLSTDLR